MNRGMTINVYSSAGVQMQIFFWGYVFKGPSFFTRPLYTAQPEAAAAANIRVLTREEREKSGGLGASPRFFWGHTL